MAKVNFSGMTVEALMDLQKRVDGMLLNPHSPDNVLSFGVTCAIQI